MPISEYDRSNLTLILAGHGNWFTAEVLRLIAKADPGNLERLRLAFPDEVQAFHDWQDEPVVRDPGAWAKVAAHSKTVAP